MVRITLVVVDYPGTDSQSLHNLTTGREILNKLKAVLSFENSTIKINGVILPMHSLSAIQDTQYVLNIYKKSLEPECIREATNHIVCILKTRMPSL